MSQAAPAPKKPGLGSLLKAQCSSLRMLDAHGGHETMMGESVLRTGTVWKSGQYNKQLKRRFFVLSSDGTVFYYASEADYQVHLRLLSHIQQPLHP